MSYLLLKRIFDIIFSLLFLFVLSIPMIFIAACIKITSHGPFFYLSDRVGINNTLFKMFKYRTMAVNTPAVATHLLKEPTNYLTPLGSFFRKYSIDESPQLINILKGDMSFVGPRPALFNQDDLVGMRTRKNIHTIIPGITGWAQINGRDDLPIPQKVSLDEYYYTRRSFVFDLRILLMTAWKVMSKEGVRH